MKLLQIPLVLAAVLIAGWLMTHTGARTQAIRRLGLALVAGLAVVTIIFPDLLTIVAGWVGIGRGADLLLYVLVVASCAFAVTVYKRFRELEATYTRLARRIALSDAPRPADSAQSTVAAPTPTSDERAASPRRPDTPTEGAPS